MPILQPKISIEGVNEFVLDNYDKHAFFSTGGLVRDYIESKGGRVRGFDKTVLQRMSHRASTTVRELLKTKKIAKYSTNQYRVIK